MLDYLCFFNFQIEKEHIRLLIWTWLGQCPENAPRSPLPEKRPRENCLPENYPPEIGPSGKLPPPPPSPDNCLKKISDKYERLQTCYLRILATDKETNIVQNKCLTEQSFLNKIATGYLWTSLFSKFVCTWLLTLHARIQPLRESRVVAIESFSIDLIDVINVIKRCFRDIEGTYTKISTAKHNCG